MDVSRSNVKVMVAQPMTKIFFHWQLSSAPENVRRCVPLIDVQSPHVSFVRPAIVTFQTAGTRSQKPQTTYVDELCVLLELDTLELELLDEPLPLVAVPLVELDEPLPLVEPLLPEPPEPSPLVAGIEADTDAEPLPEPLPLSSTPGQMP